MCWTAARSPSASALSISVPRRKPLSTSTGSWLLPPQDLRGSLGPGRARDGHFALGVEHFLPAHRAEKNGHFPGNPEHFRPQIGFGNVPQPPGAKLEVLKPFAIESQRGIVIHAAHQVTQRRGRQHAAGESLEIADTQGVGRTINRWRGRTVLNLREMLLRGDFRPGERPSEHPLVARPKPVSYTHLRAHETGRHLVCRLLLAKKK